VNKQYGNMRGYWSAVRLAEGGEIVDEYRIVGDNGETYYSRTTLRAFNGALDEWEIVSVDKGKGLQDFGTGHRDGGEMLIEQKFGVMTPNPSQANSVPRHRSRSLFLERRSFYGRRKDVGKEFPES
jgi:hypothetical protein